MSQLFIVLLGLLVLGIALYISLRKKTSRKPVEPEELKQSLEPEKDEVTEVGETKPTYILEEAIHLALEDGKLSKGEEVMLRKKAMLVGKDPDILIQQLREDLFGLEEDECKEVDPDFNPGLIFEKYVVQKFNPQFFRLDHWAGERFIADRYTSTVLNPDIQVTINTAAGSFPLAIECKWRSRQKGDYIWFAEDSQLKEYQRFAKETGRPTFIVLGLGGHPGGPEDVYLIPVNAFRRGTQHHASLTHYRKPNLNRAFSTMWKAEG